MTKPITRWLSHTNGALFSIYAIIAAFCTYSCMYAFRKPFAVATFSDMQYAGVDYKVWLITAQVLGYTLSKFIGIKYVSEMGRNRRALAILVLIGFAGLALMGFALVPPPYNIFFLFLNGLPLGMVWGLVFSYLEGRRFTEILGAGLSISFIFSSGFVKTVGQSVMLYWGVNQFWMPFVTGMLFAIPLLVFVWMLDQLPPPSALDEQLRTRREPMNARQRKAFFITFAPGLLLLIITYALLTAYRDFRDNFAAEIWNALGYGDQPMIFTLTEIPVSIVVLIAMGLVMFIKNNQKALAVNHYIVLGGLLLVGVSTFLFEQKLLNAPVWITLIGLGLYLGYVNFNSIFFERLIAAFRYVSNVGFLIYLTDSFGYLSSVGVLFYKQFGSSNISWLEFFIGAGYWTAAVGSISTALSLWYFQTKAKNWTAAQEKEAVPAAFEIS